MPEACPFAAQRFTSPYPGNPLVRACWPSARAVANLDCTVTRTMNPDVQIEVAKLVAEYRDRCLWFLRDDYMPRTTEDVRRVLDLIERYGDLAGYRRAEEIRAWL